jgi:hypothetical protein
MQKSSALNLTIYSLLAAAATLHAADPPAVQWAVNSAYRVGVAIQPDPAAINAPAGAKIDFRALLKELGVAERLDRNSIRVVRYDPVSGQPIPDAAGSNICLVPYQLTGDFANDDAGHVWWRIPEKMATRYHVYFDVTGREPAAPPVVQGLVGIGDSFHYNDGQPGFANTFPLHSAYWHLDWDGDGLRDLIGIGLRVFGYGELLENELGNAVYVYRNIGGAGGARQAPLFGPPWRIKADDGNYLRADYLYQNMAPADWDGDGDIDFIGASGDQLLFWENTGRRDRNGLMLLKQPRSVMKLDLSEYRAALPGVVGKPTPGCRCLRLVDWEGDGDLDLLASFCSVNVMRAVDSRKGVIPYGEMFSFFELFENAGNDPARGPRFARPVVIRDNRGLPITAFSADTGGAEYVDWDADGDLDLIFFDMTNRPLEGGRLMFSENDGTRENPLFLMPIPILAAEASPTVVDWNSDGRFDLLAGSEFFENVNPKNGGAVPRFAARRPSGTRLPHSEAFPKLVSRGYAQQINPKLITYFATSVDWDGDGLLDLVSGFQSHIELYKNRGTQAQPVFERGVRLAAGGKPIAIPNWYDPNDDRAAYWGPQGPSEPNHGWTLPTAADWDGDGDLDLFVAAQRWQTLYFENIGSRTQPRLAHGREVRVDGDRHEFAWRCKAGVGDLDGDGRAELVVLSDSDSAFHVYKASPTQSDPAALNLTREQLLLLTDGSPVRGWYGGQNNNGDNHAVLADWDGDGDLDLINGSLYAVWYYENAGDLKTPRFIARGKFQIDGRDLHTFNHAGCFDVADWNGDGRLDLVMGAECPSDQPRGAELHLFDRDFLEGKLRLGQICKVEKR